MTKRFFFVTTAIFVLIIATEPVSAGSNNGSTFNNETSDRTERFIKDLEKNGYIVQEGMVDYPDMPTLACKCSLPTAYAYNPSSPYGIFILPPAPDQDPEIKNPYSEWYEEDGLYPPGWGWFFRQRLDEAIVYIGTTPPEMDYFSLLHYVYDRYRPGFSFADCIKGNGDVRETPPSAIDRLPIFASLGDSINNMTVKVTGGNDNPFNKPVVVIIASDQIIEQEVRKILLSQGFPNKIINTLVVPTNIVRLGIENHSDTLMYAWRLASDRNSELESYIESPGRIFRISPESAVEPSQIVPLEMPKLRVRGTGSSEMNLLPALDALGEAIIASYPDYDAVEIGIMPWPEGYHCIENEQICLADNRDDAAFASAFNPFTLEPLQKDEAILGPHSFFIAYGVNHHESGKATYSSVSLVDWQSKVSPASFKNTHMLGSVEYYLGPQIDPEISDKLYMWKIARSSSDCNGGSDELYCKVIDESCKHGIGINDQFSFVFRIYLEAETKTGPAVNEVIMDRVIKFTPKQP